MFHYDKISVVTKSNECSFNKLMILNFIIKIICLFVLLGGSASQPGHTFSDDNPRTSKNETSNFMALATPVNQDIRGKRFESSKPDPTNNKTEDCGTVPSNNSVSDNETVNCSSSHVTPMFKGTDLNMTFRASGPKWLMSIKSGALQRTGFVVLGIMSVLVFFFVIRAIRIRQKKSKSRKYGVIASTVSDVEMEPLEKGGVEDEEEETTLFDAQQKFRIK